MTLRRAVPVASGLAALAFGVGLVAPAAAHADVVSRSIYPSSSTVVAGRAFNVTATFQVTPGSTPTAVVLYASGVQRVRIMSATSLSPNLDSCVTSVSGTRGAGVTCAWHSPAVGAIARISARVQTPGSTPAGALTFSTQWVDAGGHVGSTTGSSSTSVTVLAASAGTPVPPSGGAPVPGAPGAAAPVAPVSTKKGASVKHSSASAWTKGLAKSSGTSKAASAAPVVAPVTNPTPASPTPTAPAPRVTSSAPVSTLDGAGGTGGTASDVGYDDEYVSAAGDLALPDDRPGRIKPALLWSGLAALVLAAGSGVALALRRRRL